MSLAKNLLLSFASILIFLIVAEAVLWIVAPPVSRYALPRGLLERTQPGITLTPGMSGVMDNRRDFRNKRVNVDERGLRITPATARVARPARRIHLVGDSQTFGHGLADDETWANRLQEVLLKRGHRGVKVENYGVPGINIDQYHRRTPSIVADAQPGDVMLVGLSWNDLITVHIPGDVQKVIEGYLMTGPERTGPGDDGTGWRIKLFENTGIAVPRFKALKPFMLELSMISALASFLMPHIRGVYFALRSDNNPILPLIENGVPERNFWLLWGMKRKAEARGLRFAVVMLPSRYFFEDEVYRVYSQNGAAYPVRNYQGHITRPLCARFRITCFDPFDLLVRRNREGLVFPIDGHYNQRGAGLIGDFVADLVAPMLERGAR